MTFPDRHYQVVRKKHQCFGCNKIIAKGSPAWYSVGVWEGDFYYSQNSHGDGNGF
jgi:hypothetical protein